MHILAFDQTTLASRSDWSVLRPLLGQSVVQTLQMVLITIVVGGFLGLILGVILYGTRPGNLFENRYVYRILDILVNIIRPIPFIIFLAAMQPLTIKVIGTSIGTAAAIFPMCVMCTFATSRLVEQNLVPVDPGVIEAARSMECLEIHDHSHGADPRSLGTAHPRLCLPVHRRARHVGDGRLHRRRRPG